MKKLFVGNLDFGATGEDLKTLFAGSGTVIDSVVIMDRMTGRSRGFGFVEFSTEEEAKEGVKLNGTDFKGRKLNVSEAKPMEAR